MGGSNAQGAIAYNALIMAADPTVLSQTSRSNALRFWYLQIAGWTGWLGLFMVRSLYWGSTLQMFGVLAIDAVAGFALTTGLRYLYRAVWNSSVATRAVTVLVASYVAAAIWQPVKNYVQFASSGDFKLVDKLGYYAYFDGLLGYSYFLMVGWSGLYFGLKFYNLLQLETQRSIKAESMAHEAQLRMLRYQLNPHFLFNTLNAISTLILERNTDSANRMVGRLSNFLRYSLDNDPMQKVSLDHEMNTMRLYLDIEQVRFDDRLKVVFDVQDEARRAMVPSLLLQPLVENAIKYAVADREAGGEIRIAAKVFAGDLLLEVSDNGPGIPFKDGQMPAFSGVGIANTRERLLQLYGERQSCRFSPALPHGLKIEIRIPYEVSS